MALSIWLKYTGMKPPGSGARNSRSSTCFETSNHGKATVKTVSRVHRQRGLRGISGDAEDLRCATRPGRREAWPASGHRRIRRGLPISEGVLPLDRAAAGRQEGLVGGGLTGLRKPRPKQSSACSSLRYVVYFPLDSVLVNMEQSVLC